MLQGKTLVRGQRPTCSKYILVFRRKVLKNYLFIICCVIAIAEVYKNEGNDEYNKKNFHNAINYYTDGIKVNCKDKELNANLYSNRAAAYFNVGE